MRILSQHKAQPNLLDWQKDQKIVIATNAEEQAEIDFFKFCLANPSSPYPHAHYLSGVKYMEKIGCRKVRPPTVPEFRQVDSRVMDSVRSVDTAVYIMLISRMSTIWDKHQNDKYFHKSNQYIKNLSSLKNSNINDEYIIPGPDSTPVFMAGKYGLNGSSWSVNEFSVNSKASLRSGYEFIKDLGLILKNRKNILVLSSSTVTNSFSTNPEEMKTFLENIRLMHQNIPDILERFFFHIQRFDDIEKVGEPTTNFRFSAHDLLVGIVNKLETRKGEIDIHGVLAAMKADFGTKMKCNKAGNPSTVCGRGTIYFRDFSHLSGRERVFVDLIA